MPRRPPDDDWLDDAGEWSPDDEAEDSSEDDEEAVLPCPYCGRVIHEETVQCPGCGNYLSAEDAPPSRLPWWIILGAVVCLLIVLHWLTRRP